MAREVQFLIGDNVYGHDPGQHVAISLKDGMIELVTRLMPEEAEMLVEAEGERLLDCRGNLLLPGLIDSHTHAIATGLLMLSPSLHQAASLDEVEAAVQVESSSGRPIVRLGSLDTSRLPAAELSRLDRRFLDGLLPDKPLIIKSVEGHSSWFNTKAWELVKIDEALAATGEDVTSQAQMRASGRVYGITYENLTTPIYDTYSFEERRQGMLKVIEQAQRVGLVGLHCLEGYGEYRRSDFELILELDRRPDIDLTLYCRDATPDLALELGVSRFGGCWCLDGAIGAHTAALAEPYTDKPESRGDLYFSDRQLSDWLESGLRHDMQTCVHAIGERALDQAVSCLELLSNQYDLHELRPRIDHWVMGTPELASRAAAIGVVGAMQPVFDATWGGKDSGYAMRLGPERALRSNPVGMVVANGLRVAGSSDSYVTPLNPLDGIRAAMQHHNPECRLDFDAAVKLFTEDAAFLGHQEGTRGSIAQGYQADFVVVRKAQDPAETKVITTVKNANITYSG